jgi:uncharacterized alpha-E superfamily protein
MQNEEAASFDDKWIYHTMIYRIANELNFNPNEVYELLILDTLNWLSFFKERDEYKQKLEDKSKGITRY